MTDAVLECQLHKLLQAVFAVFLFPMAHNGCLHDDINAAH